MIAQRATQADVQAPHNGLRASPAAQKALQQSIAERRRLVKRGFYSGGSRGCWLKLRFWERALGTLTRDCGLGCGCYCGCCLGCVCRHATPQAHRDHDYHHDHRDQWQGRGRERPLLQEVNLLLTSYFLPLNLLLTAKAVDESEGYFRR